MPLSTLALRPLVVSFLTSPASSGSASLDATAAGRARLSDGFRQLQLRVYPSFTNFVSVDLGVPAQPAMQALAARGVHVRDWRHPDWRTQLRVAVGTPGDDEAVLEALAAVLAETRR